MNPPILYYRLKHIIPRPVQIWLRRGCASMRLRTARLIWPTDPEAGQKPTGFQGWPEGKRFAFVLRHDIDGAAGLAQAERLADLEKVRGVRSAFFFVPQGYGNTAAIRIALASSGFEIGVHGLTHDGMLYSSQKAFKECVGPINRYLQEWGAAGFASPSSHHNFEWLHELNMEYDTSSFDTDPFEPQPEGVGTIFPMTLRDNEGMHSYIELPYTLPQDFTIFVILRQKEISTWTEKLEWIAEHGGMALLNTHPDYMYFPGNCRRSYTYDVGLYERFLDHVQSKYGESCWHALPRDVARFWWGAVPQSCPGGLLEANVKRPSIVQR